MVEERRAAPPLAVVGAKRPRTEVEESPETATGQAQNGRSMGSGSGAADPLFLSVAAAAKTLAVSDDAIYDLVHRGDLPSIRIGRRRVIPRRAVELVVEHLLEGFDPERLAARLAASEG
jgi:excisionase family DNA binding protein